MYIVNKLKAKDNPSKLDEYFVTEVKGCAKRVIHNMNMNDKRVSTSNYPVILIPFGAYSDYKKWKKYQEHHVGYTMSVGDFIFEDDPGTVTPDNVAKLANELDAYEVKSFQVVEATYGFLNYQIRVAI